MASIDMAGGIPYKNKSSTPCEKTKTPIVLAIFIRVNLITELEAFQQMTSQRLRRRR